MSWPVSPARGTGRRSWQFDPLEDDVSFLQHQLSASVNSIPRVRRRNSCVPSSCSNCLICTLSGGWLMPSRLAARVKLSSSATATK